MFLLLLYQQKIIKNYQKVLSQVFERSVYQNQYKAKWDDKNTTNE